MNAPCCRGEGRWRRLARRSMEAAVSVLPGAALVLLPKCPMCIAAWLTAASGIAVPAAAAGGVRPMIVALWAAGAALATWQIVRRRRRRGVFPN
jgi:hypothetical protein